MPHWRVPPEVTHRLATTSVASSQNPGSSDRGTPILQSDEGERCQKNGTGGVGWRGGKGSDKEREGRREEKEGVEGGR